MDIYIKKDETKSVGNQIISSSNDFNDEVKKFLMIIENIYATAWQSAESEQYINEMKEKYIVELEKIVEFIEEYGTYLSNVPEAYSILDEVFSSKKINV